MNALIGDLRRMWRLLALSPWRVAVAVAWGVLALGSGLALAALAAWLIARAWQMPPVLDLSVAVVAVRALGISRGVARYLERLATHDVALRAMTAARVSVYEALAHRDSWWWPGRFAPPTEDAGGPGAAAAGRGLAGMRRGDLLVRIRDDIDDLGAVVVRVFVPVAVAVLLSLGAVALLATISVAGAAILAAALLLAGVVAPWLSARAAREAEEAVRGDRGEFTAQAVTVLDHAAELRVAGRLDTALAAARDAGLRAVRAEDTAARHSALAAAATPFSIGVSALGALLVGVAAYGPTGGLPGGMTPMALTILVLVPLSAFEAVGALPAAATTLTVARAALRRLEADHLAPAGAVPSPPSADSRFADLPPARRIAVVGPSGAGKTTLLMRWAGLFDTPREGVTFFAEDAHLFSTSLLENLRVGRGDLTEPEAEEALRAVGLGAWVADLPDGLHTTLDGGAAAVSGGQRRRILLARALISPARVLLLDEPTEHLDEADGERLLRALLDADSGLVAPDRVVVVVTHRLPEDHRADTVLRVTGSGEVSELFARRENQLRTPSAAH